MDLVASSQPDLVFLLGDMVVNKSLITSEFKEPMSALKQTPFGVYAVLGNHDHHTENPHNVTQLLTAAGAKVLSNEKITLEELPLTIIGFDDPGTPEWTLSPLVFPTDKISLPIDKLPGGPPAFADFTILLNHRPVDLESAASQAGVDLFLAGHTRGGSFQLPWNRQLNLGSLFYDYSSGQYSVGSMQVFVTRGLTSPISPIRLFAWPEIVIITLTSGKPETPALPVNPADSSPQSPQEGSESEIQNSAPNGEAGDGASLKGPHLFAPRLLPIQMA
jgi:predicted MPP superfamily phosphohydrolase